MPNFRDIYSGANWTEGQMPVGHGNPGTPVIDDEEWWEQGAAAAITEGAPKLFDYIVQKGKVQEPMGKYGGETSEMFDKDPGGIYDVRMDAHSDATSNMKEQYNNNQEAFNVSMAKKIDEYKRDYPNKYKNWSDVDISKDVIKNMTEIQGASEYNPDDPHFNIPFYMKESDRIKTEREGLDRWHSDWLGGNELGVDGKPKQNIGDNIVKRGFLPDPYGLTYGNAGKGKAYYSDVFDDSNRWGLNTMKNIWNKGDMSGLSKTISEATPTWWPTWFK